MSRGGKANERTDVIIFGSSLYPLKKATIGKRKQKQRYQSPHPRPYNPRKGQSVMC